LLILERHERAVEVVGLLGQGRLREGTLWLVEEVATQQPLQLFFIIRHGSLLLHCGGHEGPCRLSREGPRRLKKGHRRAPIEAFKASRQSAALLCPLPGLFVEDTDCFLDIHILSSPLQLPISLPLDGATLTPRAQSVDVVIFVFARPLYGPEIAPRTPLGDLVGDSGLPLVGLSRVRRGVRSEVGEGRGRSQVNHVGYKGVFKM
jgi:hypothetical protein